MLYVSIAVHARVRQIQKLVMKHCFSWGFSRHVPPKALVLEPCACNVVLSPPLNLNGVCLGSQIVLPCCQTIARFPNLFYFPLWPVAKFGSDFFVNQGLSLWWPQAHLPHKIAKAKNPGTHQCGLGILFCNIRQFQVFEKIQKIKEPPVPSIWKSSESKNLWFQVFQKLQIKMGVREGTSKDLVAFRQLFDFIIEIENRGYIY
jgi:hypothetical protein